MITEVIGNTVGTALAAVRKNSRNYQEHRSGRVTRPENQIKATSTR